MIISGNILSREKKLRGAEGTNYTFTEYPVTTEITKNPEQ
jgi:hypothetical protein